MRAPVLLAATAVLVLAVAPLALAREPGEQPAAQRYLIGAPNFSFRFDGFNLGGVEFEAPFVGETRVTVAAVDDFASSVSITVCQDWTPEDTTCIGGPDATNCSPVTITGLKPAIPVNVWINSAASAVVCGDLPAIRGTVTATYS
ncbi:MAG TPA: hypothetical protein VI997_07815 [Candidatus Thermoplasmatota archaeon]|nr:hypothetical protein [Candidatus Thermoplasmatota archaeon]